MPTMIRHLALRVTDLARSRAFYESGLGLRFIGYRPTGTAVDLSDGTLNVTLLPYDGPPRQPLGEGDEYIHFGVIVDDHVAIYERLRALGATFLRSDVKTREPIDPAQLPEGSFKVADPDGNVVDVTPHPDEWRGVRLD
jgi:catechol 2,3-dioxygenase-like lactoylglutathione lyase family enzyme